MALVGATSFRGIAYAAALTKAQRDKLTSDDVLALMKNGNKRFYTGKRENQNFLASSARPPAGSILPRCCSAASTCGRRLRRSWTCELATSSIVVSQAMSKSDILGSMEFACKLAGSKVAPVMGHTGCGAVKGAIDNAELGNLTGLLAKIRPAVAATTYTGERTSKNYAFVDAVAHKNVELTMADIRRDNPVLAGHGGERRDQDRRCDV